MMHDDLTCVIPTHNRPHFLRRLFHFYQQHPPGFPFMVVDSSHPAAAAENVALVNEIGGGLRVSYRHFDLNIIDKCVEGLRSVESPFVVFCADDDLLFPDAVSRCVEFLKCERGFASAMGRTAQLSPRLPRWCCRVLRGYSIDHEAPFDRCRQLAANWFTNFYAVYRTETLLDIFEITAANTNSMLNYHIPEMLLSQLSAIRGRIKVLPDMYSLMERHGTNAGSAMRVGIRPQAEQLYQRFRNCLAEQFVQVGTNRAEAEQFIDSSYSYFSEPDLGIRRQPQSTTERIQHFLHGIAEKTVGLWNPSFNKHRRFVRASDLVGCEPIWHDAVGLMQKYPLGIPSELSGISRCA